MPYAGCWHDAVAGVAARRGSAPAVVDDETTVSFEQLEQRAGALARSITDRDPGDGVQRPVAVLLGHRAAAVEAMLGIARSCRPFVGFDPTLPIERLTRMRTIAEVTTCVADRSTAALAQDAGFATIIDVDADVDVDPELGSTHRDQPSAGPTIRPASTDDVACVLFTSGSTGTPKGIRWPHGTLSKDALAGRRVLGINEADRVALVLPFSFAAGLSVVCWGLTSGATLHLFDPRRHPVADFVAWIEATRPTTLHTTPSMLRALLRGADDSTVFGSLRMLTTCGEPLRWADVASARSHLDAHASIVNWTGSTEVGVLAMHTVAPTDPIAAGVVPAGRVVDGLQVRIDRDVHDDLGAPGDEAGELVVVSDLIALGYCGAPIDLQGRFEDTDAGRAYRTGDLALLTADGSLVLRGRRDAAVKIRGYLVEPSEVEDALQDAPAVTEAAVTAHTDHAGTVRLVAHVVAVPGEVLSVPRLRAHLLTRLPAYMVPSVVVPVAELPRTDRGKVDRAALAHAYEPPRTPYRAPASDWEVRVAQAWTKALGVESPGVDDDFFDLGGDSLAAEEVLATIHGIGPDLPMTAFVETPTIAGLSRRIERLATTPRRGSDVVQLRPGSATTAITMVCFAGAGGTAVAFEMLSRELGDAVAVHAVQMHALEHRGLPDYTVGAAARRAVRDLADVPVRGRLVLAGHSYGGLVAYEVAQRLRSQGRDVALLALVDSYLPAPPSPAATTGGMGGRLRGALRSWDRLTDVDNGRSRVRTTARMLAAGIVRYDGLDQFDAFFERGIAMSRLYRPTPYSGPAVVYAAATNSLPIDHLGWGHLLAGPWELITIGGNHHTMLRRPHVAALAADLLARVPAGGDRS